jgi:hypothetical protein
MYTGDFDLFSFEVGAVGGLSVTIEWEGGADVDVALYSSSFAEVAADGTTANPAELGKDPLSQGKYILALFSKDEAAPYTATLTWTEDPDPPEGPTCSPDPVAAAMPTGGCNMNLVTQACSVANLSGGGVFEIAWTTNMTFCEGPHHVYLGGDPPSSWETGNIVSFDIASQDGSGHIPDARSGMTRNIGGYLNINQNDLSQLTSESGIYYMAVTSYYDTRTEILPFNVRLGRQTKNSTARAGAPVARAMASR